MRQNEILLASSHTDFAIAVEGQRINSPGGNEGYMLRWDVKEQSLGPYNNILTNSKDYGMIFKTSGGLVTIIVYASLAYLKKNEVTWSDFVQGYKDAIQSISSDIRSAVNDALDDNPELKYPDYKQLKQFLSARIHYALDGILAK